MLSHATPTVVPWIPAHQTDPDASLLDLLGPVDGLHVLVIGHGGLGPMLALHRRGAARVTAVCTARHMPVEAADAAIVPRLDSPDLAAAAIAHARRAIRPLNSLVLRLPANAPAGLLADTSRLLTGQGFSVGRGIALGSSTALVAELPLYGRLKCA